MFEEVMVVVVDDIVVTRGTPVPVSQVFY